MDLQQNITKSHSDPRWKPQRNTVLQNESLASCLQRFVRRAGLSVAAYRRFTIENRGTEVGTSIAHDDAYETCNISLVHRIPL